MKFGQWIFDRLFNENPANLKMHVEAFEIDAISAFQPKDGKWEPPLDSQSNDYSFYFNIPGDPCQSDNEGNPCYYANMIYNSDEITTVSFKRSASMYNDTGLGMQKEVFFSVLKALQEFITAKKPKIIRWSAVGKTKKNKITNKVENVDARKSIYFKWGLRNLFPNLYIPIGEQDWVRLDQYRKDYVTKGYPEIPQDAINRADKGEMHVGEKAKLFAALKEEAEAVKAEIERHEQEEEQRLTRERDQRYLQNQEEREAELQQVLADPQTNPNGVHVGDYVEIIEGEFRRSVGTIERIKRNDDNGIYSVHVKLLEIPEGEDRYYLGSRSYQSLNTVVKLSPERQAALEEKIRQREEQRRREEEEEERRREEEAQRRAEVERQELEAAINDPQHNPEGLKVGDAVITYYPHRQSDAGKNGKIESFDISSYDGQLKAHVMMDDTSQYGSNALRIAVKNLRKNTPDFAQRIEREQRQQEIEERIARQRERAASQAERYQQRETPEELLNDPQNPQHLKIGDQVEILHSWRHRGKFGEITSIWRYAWDTGIRVYVKLRGSQRGEQEFRIDDLRRDESEASQRIIQRQQGRQTRQTAIQTAIQSNPQGIQIGDNIEVTAGLNRGKKGRILRFVAGTQGNVRATIIGEEGNQFTAQIRSLRKVESLQGQAVA